ncbi:hypothetical protein J3458_000310 [Metarhizium acridum]|uniref:Extracellular membrane protein CFEM domain-containing protein n=1 Tax=Metarhizium acridum (strain CQMa 102) TaxID=655827 RepID=E9E0F7_METAQ|nr:uncharacterized protein MAC_03355 [Metarhizium acridum CQMa 102]EFY90577.1 hypothetical protein MAC_03355 [Metarhizium acridum CQMa 102]KAG8423409.1 hypothetical protein J3458_000310 [Metarhizium acridum]
MAPKQTRLLSSSLLLVLLAILVPGSLSFSSNFAFYAVDAQPCLYSASDASKCTGTDAQDLNSCLCNNGGGFITKAAQCLGQNGIQYLGKVYDTMEDACSTSQTPISVSRNTFLDTAGKAASSTSSSASSTASSTTSSTATSTSGATSTLTTTTGNPSPTQSNPSKGADVDNKSSGLSQGAMIGIAVGTSVAGVLAVGGMLLYFRHWQKKKAEDETSPMMAQNDYYKRGTATTFPPTEPSPSLGLSGPDAKASWGSSPSPAYPSPNLNKSPAQYAGPYAAPTPQDSPAMHGAASPAFEMDASATSTPAPGEGPVEMEGSAPSTHLQVRR